MAVCDEGLRVRGCLGLRVADASIMPQVCGLVWVSVGVCVGRLVGG